MLYGVSPELILRTQLAAMPYVAYQTKKGCNHTFRLQPFCLLHRRMNIER